LKSAQENNSRDPISKKYPSQKRAGGVAWGIGPVFKPRYQNEKKTLTVKVYAFK
jgi:hypothetical protein